MKKTSIPLALILVCLGFLVSCTSEFMLGSTPTKTASQTHSAEARLLPEEALAKAKKLIRPGSKDHLELIYNDKHQVINWIVIYDPPYPVKPNSAKSALQQNYKIQDIYPLFPDSLAHSKSDACFVASMGQNTNINPDTYFSWYSRNSYGGWRNHPDPWISQEGCRPTYSVSLNGALGAKFDEQRYSNIDTFEIPPNHPLYYLAHPGLGMLAFHAPCAMVQKKLIQLSISKSKACDNTSGPFHVTQTIDNRTRLEDGSVPTPVPESAAYCPRSLQRNSLDQQEKNLRKLSLDIASLENLVGEDALEPFKTQSFTTLANTSLDFDLTPFSVASGSPSSGPTPTPVPTTPPSQDQVVPLVEIKDQIRNLQDLSKENEDRLKTLEAYFKQSAQEYANDPGGDTTFYDIQVDHIQQVTQLKLSLTPMNEAISTTQKFLPFTCTEEPPTLSEPNLDLVFSNFNSDRSITIHGRAFGDFENFDPAQIELDFAEDIEVLEPPQVQMLGNNRFTIHLPFGTYAYTNQYQNKMDQGLKEVENDVLGLEPVSVVLRYCESGQCFSTNGVSQTLSIVELVEPYAANLKNFRKEVDLNDCTGGYSNLWNFLENYKSSDGRLVSAFNRIKTEFSYTIQNILSVTDSTKKCMILGIFKEGKPVGFIVNKPQVWQAYNTFFMLMNHVEYRPGDISVRAVAPESIALLLEHLYRPPIDRLYPAAGYQSIPKHVSILMQPEPLTSGAVIRYGTVEKLNDAINQAKVKDPYTKMATSIRVPDVRNGGISTAWGTICEDYKRRLDLKKQQKQDTQFTAVMLESLTRYHLYELLRSGRQRTSDPNAPYDVNKNFWVSNAFKQDPSTQKPKSLWESDNIIYQGEVSGSEFGINLLAIVENKLGMPGGGGINQGTKPEDYKQGTSQLIDNYGRFQRLQASDQTVFLMDILDANKKMPKPTKVWGMGKLEQDLGLIGVSEGGKSIGKEILLTLINFGIIPAVVPETKADIDLLISACK